MTPANKNKFLKLSKTFKTIATENPTAEDCLFRIFEAIRDLVMIGEDLHFRPEANDEA